jgi:hypothetical protein
MSQTADPARMLVSPGGYAVPTPNASLGFYREIFAQKGGAKRGSIQGYEVSCNVAIAIPCK